MKHLFQCLLILATGILLMPTSNAQCVADFDFGMETLGVSPNPELGEQFAPGVVGLPYEDILHILLPQYVLEIDSTLPFSPTTPLDSVSLATITLVDLSDTLITTTLEAVGLEVICNNNGDSGNPCSFLGGNQYCVALAGTPNTQGSYRVDISVNGWVTVFGFPFSQEQVFGSFILDLGEEGCTDELACNFNPQAVVDDNSCTYPPEYYTCDGTCLNDSDGDGVCDELEILGCTDVDSPNFNPIATEDDGSCIPSVCTGDVNGDGAVTVGDLLAILAEFGCTEGCTTDVNEDGLVTVADLLELLSVYGSTC